MPAEVVMAQRLLPKRPFQHFNSATWEHIRSVSHPGQGQHTHDRHLSAPPRQAGAASDTPQQRPACIPCTAPPCYSAHSSPSWSRQGWHLPNPPAATAHSETFGGYHLHLGRWRTTSLLATPPATGTSGSPHPFRAPTCHSLRPAAALHTTAALLHFDTHTRTNRSTTPHRTAAADTPLATRMPPPDVLPAAVRAPPPQLVLSPERVSRWVLGMAPGLAFLNKPAGVMGRDARRGRHGGSGRSARCLEDMLPEALGAGTGNDVPRLVHDLDQRASGLLLAARNTEAGRRLSRAVKGQASPPEAEERDSPSVRPQRLRRWGQPRDAAACEGVTLRRTFWAFLAGDLQRGQSGRISFPLQVDGAPQEAATAYRVRATGCGVTWLELYPETDVRHQLRVHCARKLGAPLIGDDRYGYRGLPPDLPLRSHLPPEWWALLGEDPRAVKRRGEAAAAGGGGGGVRHQSAGAVAPPPILLHSRQVVVTRPGKAPVVAEAPLPRYIRQLIDAAGWPHPSSA